MKQTINGITYDTEKSKTLCQCETGSILSIDLRQTPSGRFFILRSTFSVKGRRLPDGTPLTKFIRKYTVRSRGRLTELAPGVAPLHIIRPVTRRQALAFAIRAQLPRTFHRDLARFLK
jgi:hypothetical protein